MAAMAERTMTEVTFMSDKKECWVMGWGGECKRAGRRGWMRWGRRRILYESGSEILNKKRAPWLPIYTWFKKRKRGDGYPWLHRDLVYLPSLLSFSAHPLPFDFRV